MSASRVRIELCDVCACQVRVSPNFKGTRVLCPEHRTEASKRLREEDAAFHAYEDECAEDDERFQDAEDEPWDVIDEDAIDLPPIASIVRPHEWIVKLDIRGSHTLAVYDRRHMASAASVSSE